MGPATPKPPAATGGFETESRGNGSQSPVPAKENQMMLNQTTETERATLDVHARVLTLTGGYGTVVHVDTYADGRPRLRVALDGEKYGPGAPPPAYPADELRRVRTFSVDVDDEGIYAVLTHALEDFIQSERDADDAGAAERLTIAERLLNEVLTA